jgi:hypothetical protein
MSFITRLLAPDYMLQPPAYFHTRVLVGAGGMLRPSFAKRYDITHVINCAFDEDSPTWWRQHVPNNYVVLNAVDSRTGVNIMDFYPRFEETMLRFLREGSGVVYVHCQAGMNRSASLALAYSCAHFHMDLDALVAATKRQRPCILQNTVFTNQVKKFIDGRLQSQEVKRSDLNSECNRNVGLFASRYRADSEGVKDHAGDLEDRMRDFEDGDRTPSFEERDNGRGEGEQTADPRS